MFLNIKNSTGYGNDTEITLKDGTALKSVSDETIRISADGMVVAELKFIVPRIDCNAEATVSEEHLRELAHAHGFKLIKDEK